MFCQTLAVNAIRSLKALQKLWNKDDPVGDVGGVPGVTAANSVAQAFLMFAPETNRITPRGQALAGVVRNEDRGVYAASASKCCAGSDFH